jgi:hypothetical protein
MARLIALAVTPPLAIGHEVLRMAVVCGCALALILARQPLPL